MAHVEQLPRAFQPFFDVDKEAPLNSTEQQEAREENATLGNNNDIERGTDQKQAAQGKKGTKCCEAQKQHFKTYRDQIDKGLCKEFLDDWMNVLIRRGCRFGPNAKNFTPEDFYVKASAVFVPHLLFPRYRAYCPICESGEHVNCSSYRWVDFPMILYCLGRHKYLDTVRYTCDHCKSSFRATNLKSLSLDKTGQARAIFRIYLLSRSAVDEDLYLHITKQPFTPTAQIARHLRDVVAQKYISDVIEFLMQTLHGRVRVVHRSGMEVLRHDQSQPLLKNYVPEESDAANQPVDSQKRRQIELCRRKEQNQKWSCDSLKAKADSALEFEPLITKKSSNKQSILPGLGTSKLQTLVNAGIKDGRTLVRLWEQDRSDPRLQSVLSGLHRNSRNVTMQKWVDTIKNELLVRQQAYDDALAKLQTCRDQLSQLQAPSTAGAPVVNNTVNNSGLAVAETTDDSQQLPTFSRMLDRGGYNARYLTTYMVDEILQSDHERRAPAMLQTITSLTGSVLSVDTVYGPANRVVVYKDRKPFRPFTGMTTVMNEFNEVIWYGFITTQESVEEIREHLIALRNRIERLKGPGYVKVIYVDNCCNVRKIYQEIFGDDVLIKLDLYHWMKRWDDCLRDPKSEESGVFRGLMSRACLVANPAEYEEKRQHLLKKLKRNPTPSEVLRECATVIPQPPDLERAIRAIIEYFLLADSRKALAAASMDDRSERRPQMLFRSTAAVMKRLNLQLEHLACLSDPPDVQLHFRSQNGRLNVARGSPKNERFNRTSNNKVLAYSQVGLTRADRCFLRLVYDRYIKAKVTRHGELDHFTDNLESMALANSLGQDAGYDEVVFKDVSLPTAPPTKEKLGFCLGIKYDDREQLEETTEEEDEANASDDFGDDDMIVAPADQEPDVDHAETVIEQVNAVRSLLNDAVLGRSVGRSKTTLQTFFDMTGGHPWMPFSYDPSDENAVEELRVFDERSGRFDRHVAPGKSNGYNAFREEWNSEAGRRYLAKLSGTPDIISIYHKTTKQLQDHFDKLEEERKASVVAGPGEKESREKMRSELRAARSSVARPAVVQPIPVVHPSHYPPHVPFGAPTTLNPEVMGSGVTVRASVGGRAPYQMPKPVSLPSVSLPRGFSFRVFCKRCGRRKGDHGGYRCSEFGDKCTFDCCGRCGLRNESHVMLNTVMGVKCTVSPSQGADSSMIAAFDEMIESLNKSNP